MRNHVHDMFRLSFPTTHIQIATIPPLGVFLCVRILITLLWRVIQTFGKSDLLACGLANNAAQVYRLGGRDFMRVTV